MHELQKYSTQLHQLDRAAADRDILWVFSRSAIVSDREEKQSNKRKVQSSSAVRMAKRRRRSSSTSPAPHERERKVQSSSAVRLVKKRRRSSSTSPAPHENVGPDEVTSDSASTSEPGHADQACESTSDPESDELDLQSSEDGKPWKPQKRKHYKTRIATKRPSVQLAGIIPADDLKVCLKSAYAFLRAAHLECEFPCLALPRLGIHVLMVRALSQGGCISGTESHQDCNMQDIC